MSNIVVETEEQSQQQQSQNQAPSEEKPEDRLPPKFRGKSMEDVISMYSELESEYGRRGNEVGQLRRLTDELLGLERAKRELESAKSTPKQKITTDQLFEKPEETIAEVARAAADERTRATDERVQSLERRMIEQAFEDKHKGYRQTMQSEDFINFVKASDYRKGLVVKAAQDDWMAADELFNAYGEYNQLRGNGAPQQKDTPLKQAREAGLVKSGGSSAANVVPRGGEGKKVYSRMELINMRIHNPEEFDSRYTDEFLPAYLEGRVK